MIGPADAVHPEPEDDDERLSNFAFDEAQHLLEMQELYEAGWFEEDDPYRSPEST